MPISFDEKKKQCHIQTAHASYVMDILPGGWLRHLYWGARVECFDGASTIPGMDRSFSANPVCGNRDFSLDTTAQEFPAYGNTDFREPAICVLQADGSRITDFRYQSHCIAQGKRGIHGLPSIYAGESQAENLTIVLRDEKLHLDAVLTYSILEDSDAILRSVRMENHGIAAVRITHAMSACVDLGDVSDFALTHSHWSLC